MQEIDDHMDTLFRTAAENYRLKDRASDWDKIAGRLSSNAIKPASAPSTRKYYILFLLLLVIVVAGGLWVKYGNPASSDHLSPGDDLVVSPLKKEKYKQSVDSVQKLKNDQKNIATSGNKNALKQTGETENNNEAALIKDENNSENRTKQNKRSTVKLSAKPNRTISNKQLEIQPVKTYRKPSRGIAEEQFPVFSNNINSKKSNPDVIVPPGAGEKEKQVSPISTITENEIDSTIGDPVMQQAKDSIAASLGDTVSVNLQAEVALIKKNTDSIKRRSFYAGIIGGVEWNEVQQQGFGKGGYDLGILVGYQWSKRWAVEAGVLIAKKYYYSEGRYFYLDMPGKEVLSLEGSTNIIEVPIRLKYDWVHTPRSTFFTSAGIISYFLTNEKNDYVLLVNGAEMNMTTSYPGSSRYFAAAIDISSGYEHAFKNYKVRLAPYLQVPLKGIGVGSMRVMSAGVHLGLTRRW